MSKAHDKALNRAKNKDFDSQGLPTLAKRKRDFREAPRRVDREIAREIKKHGHPL